MCQAPSGVSRAPHPAPLRPCHEADAVLVPPWRCLGSPEGHVPPVPLCHSPRGAPHSREARGTVLSILWVWTAAQWQACHVASSRSAPRP